MTRCPICGRTDPHGHGPLPTAPDVVAEAWPPANAEWAPGVTSWAVGAEWCVGLALAQLGYTLQMLCLPLPTRHASLAPIEGASHVRQAVRLHSHAIGYATLAEGLARRVREGWPPRR